MTEMVIKLSHVVKEYKTFSSPKQRLIYSLTKFKKFKPTIFTATDDVSFEIPKGQILGIIGRNGAGKSTILKLITGVSFPTRGTLAVHGRISSLLELGAGFNMELTGLENVYFQADLMGLSKETIEERMPDILAFAEIGDFINQPVKNYSSGMFARLAFATAINVSPDILIVDEVLAVGDIAFQFKCIEKMKEFAQKGVTIIFVTHSMMSLYRFCQRAIWIDKGKIVMDGPVEDVVPRYEDNIKQQDIVALDTAITTEFIKMNKFSLIQAGEIVDQVEQNQAFSLIVDYELMVDLPEAPYFALSITKSGVSYDMFGIFPSKEQYTLEQEKGCYTIAIEFANPNFNIGNYDIQFSIMEKNGISQLYFGRAVELVVVGEHHSLGLVDIAHHVVLTKYQ